jgi:diacylglycerol kinase (ATP)
LKGFIALIVQRAFLIYNPASGQKRAKRTEQISRVTGVLRAAGVTVEACATTHAGSAVQQAQEAAEAGFDTVVACGGDGTANEALNGLMRASTGAPTLGLVPLGSGNLLASDLRLPSDPAAAAQALLSYKPCPIRPGIISSQIQSSQGQAGPDKRYFIVAAGVGADAELMFRTPVKSKERFGRNAYFLEMVRMALRRGYPMFHAEWEDEQGARHEDKAMLVMAIRAKQFPGLLRFVNLGSALTRDSLCLLLFHTNKVRHFLNYFSSVSSGLNWKVPQVGVVHSKWFRCTALPGENEIHSQADGELLGTLPVEVSIENRTFNLLMP